MSKTNPTEQEQERLILRDEFAMAALPACITIVNSIEDLSYESALKEAAETAYAIADAMLEARG